MLLHPRRSSSMATPIAMQTVPRILLVERPLIKGLKKFSVRATPRISVMPVKRSKLPMLPRAGW